MVDERESLTAPAGVVPGIIESERMPPDVRRKPFMLDPRGRTSFEAGVFPPPAAAPARVQPVSPPPWLYEPWGCFVFDLPLIRIPAVVAPGATAILAQWPAIPQGYRAVVRRLGYVVTAGALADGLLVCRRNGAPVTPFTGTRGAIGDLANPQQTFIGLEPGDVFLVEVTNTGLANITVAVRTYGWQWRD